MLGGCPGLTGKCSRVSGQAIATRRSMGAGCRCGTVYLGLGGGFEGDLVAHRGELGDVVAQLPFGVDAQHVVVGSEVAEAGCRVGEQVPDDDEDRAGDRD